MNSLYALVDISNSFTKIAFSDGDKLGSIQRIATPELSTQTVQKVFAGQDSLCGLVLCSVVPEKGDLVKSLSPVGCFSVRADADLGIGIDYPNPKEIGADRLANSVACLHLHGAPAVVVDFGTAVTFDVLSASGTYLGGVIAPGLNAMTRYLHEKTALLPQIELREPEYALGKSTEAAMRSGAVFGYRGLIREILAKLRDEVFPGQNAIAVATGGDAELLGSGLPIFDVIDPSLTLQGLRILAHRHFGAPV